MKISLTECVFFANHADADSFVQVFIVISGKNLYHANDYFNRYSKYHIFMFCPGSAKACEELMYLEDELQKL